MPQLQVLQREADPQENQMLKSMQQMQENIRAERQSQAYLWQVKQMMKNADNEEKRAKFERKYKATQGLIELKKLGLGEEGFNKYLEMFQEDGIDAVHGLGEDLAKAKGEVDPIEEAIANKLNGGGRPMPQARVGVGIDGESGATDMNPRMGPMQGQAQSSGNVLFPKYTHKGLEIVFPDDAAAEVTNTTRAKNMEELQSGKLAVEEQNIVSVAPAALASLNSAISRLNEGKFGQEQNIAIDTKNPWFAGKDIQDIQQNLNNVKAVMNKLMGYGAAFTDSEQRLVSAVTDLNGKTPENIQLGLRFLKDIFQRKTDLVKRGRAALWDDSKETAFQQEAAFMATAMTKGFTKAQINAGLKVIRGGK